jgi:hypothetical protein
VVIVSKIGLSIDEYKLGPRPCLTFIDFHMSALVESCTNNLEIYIDTCKQLRETCNLISING